MGSQSVRIGFLFSCSYIAACINIRLGLKWKWSANFSIQAKEDKQQTKQRRNHLTTQRNKNTFQMINLPCRSSCSHAAPTRMLHPRHQSLAVGDGEGQVEDQDQGDAAGCLTEPARWTTQACARGPSPCQQHGSQNICACWELSKMRKKKKKAVMETIWGRCWIPLSGSVVLPLQMVQSKQNHPRGTMRL